MSRCAPETEEMGSKYREVPLKVEYHQNSYDPVVTNCVIELEHSSPGKLADGEIHETKVSFTSST